MTVTLTSDNSDAVIYYTDEGTNPDPDDWFGPTMKYDGPFELYQAATIKAVAVADRETGDITCRDIDVTPVTLSIGESHSFNGLVLTLDDILWYSYETYSHTITETDKVALQFSVKNQTGKELDTNPLYSWGYLIENPGSYQLNSVYSLYSDQSNLELFDSYALLSGSQVRDGTLFMEVSPGSTSFVFKGSAPYYDDGYTQIGYYFEVPFSRSDIDVVSP